MPEMISDISKMANIILSARVVAWYILDNLSGIRKGRRELNSVNLGLRGIFVVSFLSIQMRYRSRMSGFGYGRN